VVSGPSVERFRCRCGAEVISNRATLTIAHALPECDWFRAALRQNPPSRTTLGTEAEVISGREQRRLEV
jgi:hypothetical protein